MKLLHSPNLLDAKSFHSRRYSHVSLLAGACVSIAMLMSGCAKSDRPKTIPVTGLITKDGQPPEYLGALFFAPIEVEEGYPKRPGRALFEQGGEFAATSYVDGDGLVPGTYRVRVECWKKPPGMGSAGVSYVPKGFEAPDLVVPLTERSVTYDLDLSR